MRFVVVMALVQAMGWVPTAHAAGNQDGAKTKADKDAARAEWHQGGVAYNLGHYDEAAKHYEAAYTLVQDPAFLFNIAQSYRKGGKLDQSLDRYRAFLRTTSADASNRDTAEKFVEEINRTLEEERETASVVPPKAAPDKESPPPGPAETPASPASPGPAPQPPHGCEANQVPIPRGTFWMGAPDLDMAEPLHQVTLSPYCIDKTEVTVAAFRTCVQDGGCPPAYATDGPSWKKKTKKEIIKPEFCTWEKIGFDQHPMNCVDWNQATTYCAWTGGRLPTEAEWEYAARGTDGRKYPWGNEAPVPMRLNMSGKDDGWERTAPVGSYPKGASPFGALDMAGNVWEWTADGVASYDSKAVTNPQQSRPAGSPRIFRGGGWHNDAPARLRAEYRDWGGPGTRVDFIGFRCAHGVKL